MAITKVGTTYKGVATDGTKQSIGSITVDSDCEISIVTAGSTGNGGQPSLNILNWDNGNDIETGWIQILAPGSGSDDVGMDSYYMLEGHANHPAAGSTSQTLYFGWNLAPWASHNANIHLFYLDGIDTGTPLISGASDSQYNPGSTSGWTADLSGGTVTADDMAIIAANKYYSGQISSGTGQTNIADDTDQYPLRTDYELGESSPSLSWSSESFTVGLAFAVAAAGGYTQTVGAGSYVLTGSDIGLIKDSSVVLDAGSYSVTGSDVSLLHDYLTGIGAGSYVVTGSDITLTYSGEGAYSIDIGAGSYLLTGSAVGLTHDRLLSIGGGTYAVTGSDIDLLRGYLLGVDAGSYVLTGSDIALLRGYLTGIGAGSYIITGSDVTLTYTPIGGYTIVIDGGSYAITGADIALKHDRLLSIGQGTYSVAGTAIDLLRGYLVSAEAGSYTLTGGEIDLLHDYLLGLGIGTYLIGGQNVTLTYSGIELPSGLVSVTFTTARPKIVYEARKPIITFN